MKLFAFRDNEKGIMLLDEGALVEAEEFFRKAIHSAPNWSVPWYNLGLVYKQQRKWNESLECNQNAVRLNTKDQAALWNIGIAATALGMWRIAREAWSSYGIDMPIHDEEPRMNVGSTPIRLNPNGNGEVVWCSRIDPARALIQNVPLPDSQHRYHDLLLHDGAPKGTRLSRGKQVPVFDEIQILVPSDYSTFCVMADVESAKDAEDLMELAQNHELAAEDWSTIRALCKACSEGTPDEHSSPTYHSRSDLKIGIAAKDCGQLEQLIEGWLITHPVCKVSNIECLLDASEQT